MNGFVQEQGRGRFGNCIFRYLASRLFCILYDYQIVKHSIPGMIPIDDNTFKVWKDLILTKDALIQFEHPYFSFEMYYQHDSIYRKFKSELLDYIKNHQTEELITDRNEIYTAKDLISVPPVLPYTYNTVVHLRIEDFFLIDSVIHPTSISKVLEKCAGPYLFIHKPEESTYDKKYISYFKKQYPTSYFFTGSAVDAYNIMRTSSVLVCGTSTISWAAALLSTVNPKVYMPRNNGKESHCTFQYPNDNTEIYDYTIITKEEVLMT